MTIRRSAPRADSAGRRPRQERGQRRVEAVLDAAAEAVAESGVAGLTMQDVGRRSGTTAGSLYHFFPDREALLRALGARHVERLRAAMAPAAELAPEDWARLSIDERVDRFVGPVLDYVDANADLLPIMGAAAPAGRKAPGTEDLHALVLRAAERLVAACDPAAGRAERTARAALLIAAVEGALLLAGRPAAPPQRTLLRELRRMLAAYLQAPPR
jgi:AcrR family transcriptional regulator